MPNPLIVEIAAQAFGGLLANLASSYLARPSRSLSSAEKAIQIDLKPHFESTYERCSRIKTILNDSPVETLSVYVDQRFTFNNEIIDQYDLIETILHGRSVIITGTGGGGKSMFMRYLWISFFVRGNGKIPLFFELRNTNSLSHENFVDYLFHSVTSTNSSISPAQFESALANGEFVLFLDGFDEIYLEQRQRIEQAILGLRSNFPKLTIVVTSRPDDRFRGWQQFDEIRVLPLDKKQVIQLVERAPYDSTHKKRLINRIQKQQLYETHGSFLSIPLLAYMMLLTIARNPDIPTRMHLFYDQAFDALFHRHDTTKGGYQRRFRTGVDKSVFLRCIAYFSLITYHDQCVEADEETLIEYARKAIAIEAAEVSPRDLVKDLEESVCILARDGLQLFFVHRSFQEYFAAYCICRVANRNIERMFSNFADRYDDQVMNMVYQMDPDLFREKYLIAISKKYKQFFERKTNRNIVKDYMFLLGAKFDGGLLSSTKNSLRTSRAKSQPMVGITLSGDGEFWSFRQNFLKLAPSMETPRKNSEREEQRRRDSDCFIDNVPDISRWVGRARIYSDRKNFLISYAESGSTDAELGVSIVVQCVGFQSSPMYQFMLGEAVRMKEFVSSEQEKYRHVTSSFEEYFS